MNEFRAGVTASLRSWSALRTAVETGWGGAESIRKAEVLRSQLFEIFSGESVPPKGMADLTDLEDALAIFMEEEFSVVLEDGSEKQLADVIWKMYESCALRGDVQMATQAVTVAENAVAKLNQGYFPVQIVAPENADESDDDDEENTAENPADIAQSMETMASPAGSIGPVAATEPADGMKGANNAVAEAPAQDVKPMTQTTAAEYAAQPLFAMTKKRKTVEEPPPRQLGEKQDPEPVEAMVDEDGFAPVTKQKRRARNPV